MANVCVVQEVYYQMHQFYKIKRILKVSCNHYFMLLTGFTSVKVQSDGVWGCGVASERCDLNNVPLGESSWTFRNDLGFYSQANKIESADIELNEGDVIGVTYDHVTLQFYLNGYSVGNGKWIDLILSEFLYLQKFFQN